MEKGKLGDKGRCDRGASCSWLQLVHMTRFILYVFACMSSLDGDMSSISLAVPGKKQESKFPLLYFSHANKKICVWGYIKLSQASGNHFYNEKSSREVQLNKICVSVTVTRLSTSQSESAD